VMVTHDPVAASYADRVLFLVDGRIVDEILAPTTTSVLERMKGFELAGQAA
jgi:putative ABC transport system ATP-binding protein